METFAGLISLTRTRQLDDISSGFGCRGIERRKRDTAGFSGINVLSIASPTIQRKAVPNG
jgi:hypothetical protein